MDEADLQTRILELAVVKMEIKKLEAKEEALAASVMEGLFEQPSVFQEDGSISYGAIPSMRVAVETKTTTTVSREKLIAQGVDIAKIVEATNVTESKPFIRIYPRKVKEEKAVS